MSGFIDDALGEIREAIAPSKAALDETRQRRDLVRSAAASFRGTNAESTFVSGSLAHGTANAPLNDGDAGVILDRRVHQSLGPDGDGPTDVMSELRDHMREHVTDEYADATLEIIKRAIIVRFHEPLDDQSDPSVDIVVALRREEGGLWIPNNDRDRWDPSDPIAHTSMIVSPNATTGSTFARAVRLLKAWNHQYSTPALCSFNVEALALSSIDDERSLATALETWFDFAATDLRKRLTPDPAGVSAPIKLPAGMDRDTAVGRIGRAGDHYAEAREAAKADDVETALEELGKVFKDYSSCLDKAARVASLRVGNSMPRRVAVLGGVPVQSRLKTTTAWGSR